MQNKLKSGFLLITCLLLTEGASAQLKVCGQNKKWGLCNQSKLTVQKAEYDTIITYGSVQTQYPVFYVGYKGSFSLIKKIDADYPYSNLKGILFKNGNFDLFNSDGKLLLDSLKDIAIRGFQYHLADSLGFNYYHRRDVDTSELMGIKGNKGWGAANFQGQIVVPLNSTALEFFRGKYYKSNTDTDTATLINFIIAKNKALDIVYDLKGKVILPEKFDNISYYGLLVNKEKFRSFFLLTELNGKWGAIDQQFHELIANKYDTIIPYNSGNDGEDATMLVGVINGRVVHEKSDYKLIEDKKKVWVLQYNYNLGTLDTNFFDHQYIYEGLVKRDYISAEKVDLYNSSFTVVQKDVTQIVVDDINLFKPKEIKEIFTADPHENYTSVQKKRKNKWIVADSLDMKIQADNYFNKKLYTNGSQIAIKKNNAWGTIDLYGNTIIPITHDEVPVVIGVYAEYIYTKGKLPVLYSKDDGKIVYRGIIDSITPPFTYEFNDSTFLIFKIDKKYYRSYKKENLSFKDLIFEFDSTYNEVSFQRGFMTTYSSSGEKYEGMNGPINLVNKFKKIVGPDYKTIEKVNDGFIVSIIDTNKQAYAYEVIQRLSGNSYIIDFDTLDRRLYGYVNNYGEIKIPLIYTDLRLFGKEKEEQTTVFDFAGKNIFMVTKGSRTDTLKTAVIDADNRILLPFMPMDTSRWHEKIKFKEDVVKIENSNILSYNHYYGFLYDFKKNIRSQVGFSYLQKLGDYFLVFSREAHNYGGLEYRLLDSLLKVVVSSSNPIRLGGNIFYTFKYPNYIGYNLKKGDTLHLDYQEIISHGKEVLFKKRDNWGLLDENGKIKIRPEYTEYVDYGDNILFRNKKTEIIYDNNGLLAAKKDGKWGLIDIQGQVIMKSRYHYISKKDTFHLRVAADSAKSVNPSAVGYYLLNNQWNSILKKTYKHISLYNTSSGNYRLTDNDGTYTYYDPKTKEISAASPAFESSMYAKEINRDEKINFEPEWITTKGPEGCDATALYIDDKNNYWLGTGSSGGMFLSEDKGQSWIEKNNGIGPYHIQYLDKLRDTLFIFTEDHGAFCYDEKNSKWSPYSDTVMYQLQSSAQKKNTSIEMFTQPKYAFSKWEVSPDIYRPGTFHENSAEHHPGSRTLLSYQTLLNYRSRYKIKNLPKDIFHLPSGNHAFTLDSTLLFLAKSGIYAASKGTVTLLPAKGMVASDVRQLVSSGNDSYYALVGNSDVWLYEAGKWQMIFNGYEMGLNIKTCPIGYEVGELLVGVNGNLTFGFAGDIWQFNARSKPSILVKHDTVSFKDSKGVSRKYLFYPINGVQTAKTSVYGVALLQNTKMGESYCLFKYEIGKIKIVQILDNNRSDDNSLNRSCVFLDALNNVWLKEKSILSMILPDNTFVYSHEMIKGNGSAIAFSKTGKIAILDWDGIWVFDPETKNWEQKKFTEKLSNTELISLAFDDEDNIFLGTGVQYSNIGGCDPYLLKKGNKPQGLYKLRYNGKDYDLQEIKTYPNQWILSIAPHSRGLFVGTSGSGAFTVHTKR